MREEQVTAYIAFDGKRFASPKECRDYEDSQGVKRLAGLTVEQVQAALDRTDPELADAFENFGMQIRGTRQKSGVFRRKPSKRESAAGKANGGGADAVAGQG